jgi:hypothetical protein
MSEQWLPVVGYEDLYWVSSRGRVKSRHGGLSPRPMSQYLDQAGYPVVGLSRDGKRTKYRVHVLMLTAFSGPRPPECLGRHLDDVKANNNIENLAWGTSKENSDDKYRNGIGNQHFKKTHCVNGHELVGDNIYQNRLPKRVCRVCNIAKSAAWHKARRSS